MSSKKSKYVNETVAHKATILAKRDHVIAQNNFHFEIKKGDDLDDEKKFPGLLENFEAVLKLEKVL